MPKHSKIPQKLQAWIEARRRHRLSHAHVQMARELGMNPKKLGKIANHQQEPWKLPLPQFIENCYRKSFKRDLPLDCRSIEDKVAGKPPSVVHSQQSATPVSQSQLHPSPEELQRINRMLAEVACDQSSSDFA
jgi:hypothetical protein